MSNTALCGPEPVALFMEREKLGRAMRSYLPARRVMGIDPTVATVPVIGVTLEYASVAGSG